MAVDPVSLAITVALDLASMALTASRQIEGPRLTDLKASTADYGTPLIQFYGTKRLECICIYAEDIREEKHQNKTKGGKYNEYKYFGTWASFVADHEINAVLQVWLDRHLVFDRTGTGGPITPVLTGEFGISTGLKTGSSNFRVYLGTETQDPDPRLLAKIEAKEGAGTCPAYLGLSYMVFEDIPLDLFGNRLPQVSCQATRAEPIPHYPFDQEPTAVGGNIWNQWAISGTWMIRWDFGIIEFWDLRSRTLFNTVTGIVFPFVGTLQNVTVDAFGTASLYGFGGSGGTLTTVTHTGSITQTLVSGGDISHPHIRALTSAVYASGGSGGYIKNGVFVSTTDSGRDFCEDDEGGEWGVFQPTGSSSSFSIVQVAGGTESSGTLTATARSAVSDAPICYCAATRSFMVTMGGRFYIVSRDTWLITASGVAPWGGFDDLPYNRPSATSFWASDRGEYSLEDGSLIQSVNLANWLADGNNTDLIYDPVNIALVSAGSFVDWRYLDRATGAGWALGDICFDVAIQCGMRDIEADFADLDQNIPGYSWTQGPGKSIIGPLLDLHDSDVRPHGFVQQGLKRGQALSGDTISFEWMVNETRGDESASQPLYSIPITSETDLPLRVAATFADPNMEEQPNTAAAQRNAASVKTNREQSFDLTTLNDEPDVIQGLLERALRRYWVGSTKPQFLVTPLEIRLEPADVRMVLLEDNELLRCRAIKVGIRANRVLDTEWELDGETQVDPPSWELDDASPLNAVFNTPPGLTYGRPVETVPQLVATKGFVFDTPLLSDSDDQTAPFLYDAAGPLVPNGTWFGSGVWTADENEADTEFAGNWDSFSGDEAATWGLCQTTLPDAATDVVDERSTLRVRLMSGTSLSSITDDEMLADRSANLALVGGELIQFRDADLVSTGLYDLTGLVRGARNSEYATDGHDSGETFLLLGSTVHKRTVGASEIGDTDYYKFSTTGSDLDFTETISVAFAANAHRPSAPAHLELSHDSGTGDWTITWLRRTRIGGSAVNGQDVPLGETSEAYRVKIMNGDAVVSTHDTTTASFTYTNAEQVVDWGSARSALTVQVCQMSPALSLEGFASTASG